MKTSMKIEKVSSFTINGETVKVSSLPEDIRYEIETFDKMNQDKMDAYYNLELIDCAVQAKKAQIMSLITNHLNKSKPTETTKNENEIQTNE